MGQIVEALNPPQDMASYSLKEDEVKMVRPKYNIETGEFLGIYETVGYIIVRVSPEEVFFNISFDKEKSKFLYSHYRRRILNVFCRTMYNRHRTMVQSGELESDFSHLYFFLPSIADCSVEINQYLENVSITPIDIKQSQLDTSAGDVQFDPLKFDTFGLDKKRMSKTCTTEV